MPNTLNPAVNNNIALAQKFLPLLDEVYKTSSRTSILDTEEDRVRWIGAKTVNLFNIDMGGLGDYDRNAGFVRGNANGGWEPYTLNVDRGRSFSVDVMDNDETLGMAFGSLMGEFARTREVPEVDAYRFAKYAANAGLKAAATQISTSTDIAGMVDEADAVMGNAEVPEDGRILFLSYEAYAALQGNITRSVENDATGVNRVIERYNGNRVIKVPASRFYTGCTLNKPTTSDDFGGFTNSGARINFMLLHPSAILQVIKHQIPRVFSPQENQQADGWMLNYRIYHDAFVKLQKKDGIYICTAPISLSAASVNLTGTGNTTVTVTGASGATTVSSANTGVATAQISSGTVTITGVAAGKTVVTVKDAQNNTATIQVTVKAA